ncbi:MAG: NAD(P)/FAD-dependent oxidoreductase [Burkholderiaceae bacterium]|nr:NAD(P)/FAD-dependent oxidoreductase [Burkholderiaceae bacterium]
MSLSTSQPTPTSLEQQLNHELELLCLPEAPWMPQCTYHGENIMDVAIIGAGMAGLTAAAALKFIGIANIGLYDAAPANQEGPWATHARMQTLRSPKELTGPALGIPSLTFRAWYTSVYGKSAWKTLDRIPRLVWHDYLQWYKQALALPVHNQHSLTSIQTVQADDINTPIIRLEFSTDSGVAAPQIRYARHLVLATGMDGLGGANIPATFQNLDRSVWRHSSEIIDFSSLRSKRVAIIGGGDSALDAAATALEAQATQVDIYIRTAEFSQINYWKAFAHSGHRYGYQLLNQAQRATMLGFLLNQPTPPSRGTIQRLSTASNLSLHFNQHVEEITAHQGELRFSTDATTTHTADFLILATGYQTDLQQRPELRPLLPHLRFFDAGALDGRKPEQGGIIPMLEEDFSFCAKTEDGSSLLSRTHCFTSQALLSLGKICGDIPGISVGAQRLAQGIAAKLYKAEHTWHSKAVQGYDEHEVSDEALEALYALAPALHD